MNRHRPRGAVLKAASRPDQWWQSVSAPREWIFGDRQAGVAREWDGTWSAWVRTGQTVRCPTARVAVAWAERWAKLVKP